MTYSSSDNVNSAPHSLSDRTVWIFDLDNTLYPAETNLFVQIDVKMGSFISELLGVGSLDARRIQKQFFHEYGTTLNGLMKVHDIDPDSFLDYVHDIDHSSVTPDPGLGAAIAQLPGQKYVFTNGTETHALKVLSQLGLQSLINRIFDIRTTEYTPKPFANAYHKVVSEAELDPLEAVMFEDIPRNLEVPAELGMATVLVEPKSSTTPIARSASGPFNTDHIDHITDDLTLFLDQVRKS